MSRWKVHIPTPVLEKDGPASTHGISECSPCMNQTFYTFHKTGWSPNAAPLVLPDLLKQPPASGSQDIFVLKSELPGGFGPQGGLCKFKVSQERWELGPLGKGVNNNTPFVSICTKVTNFFLCGCAASHSLEVKKKVSYRCSRCSQKADIKLSLTFCTPAMKAMLSCFEAVIIGWLSSIAFSRDSYPGVTFGGRNYSEHQWA